MSSPPGNTASERTSYPFVYAHTFRRMYASVVDIGLLLIIIVIVNMITGGNAFAGPDTAPQDIFILLGYLILFTGIKGQTPGKMVAGIIVVDDEGHVPGVAVAIPREMVGRLVASAALGLGLAWISFDARHQGWHDKIAGTYVVMKPKAERPEKAGVDGFRPGARRNRERPWRFRRKR
ncbi:MAG: RDD family protein [Dehalococcoidia bacterium]|nr:RDD family protein [Dehalococcoidia bacterium]